MTKVKLQLIPDTYTVHRFNSTAPIPAIIYDSDFFTISKTSDELSVVCSSALKIPSIKAEKGWSCFRVIGTLDFSLTGILAEISSCLATAKISIFAISTYDTDYILVKSADQEQARNALQTNGYIVEIPEQID